MLFDIYVISLLFIAGLFIGMLSILYGVRGMSLHNMRASYCSCCHVSYHISDLLPIISYFLNRGKCKYCHHKFPFYFPLLELLTGILFSFSYITYGFSYEMFVMILLTVMLVNIFVSDFTYYIILDNLLLIMSFLVLLLKFLFFGFETFLISICSGIILFLFMMIVRFIGDRIFQDESLGGGDIKLAAFFGFLLGVRLSIVSLILGSFLAFPYAIYCSLHDKQKEIPFGPFLVSGMYFVFLFMDVINRFLSIIF